MSKTSEIFKKPIGWIYQYAIVDHESTHDMRELRLLNESQIKPALQALPGVAEVASVGGLEEQFQLKIFPMLLVSAGIPLGRHQKPAQVVTNLKRDFSMSGQWSFLVTFDPNGRAQFNLNAQ